MMLRTTIICLQVLEAKALEEPLPPLEDFQDLSQPNMEAMQQSAGAAIQQFKVLLIATLCWLT